MANNQFENYGPGLESPISSTLEVTPSDSTDLDEVSRAIYIGNAGNLRVTMVGGMTANFANMPVGWHPLRVSRVHNTGTIASNIVGCW